MKRYTSSRTNQRFFRLAAFIVTLVVTLGIVHVFRAFDRVRHAVASAPLLYGLLALGIALLILSFRYSILALFGLMMPTYAARLVSGYLERLDYVVTQLGGPPYFGLKVQDPEERWYGVAWEVKPYTGVSIFATCGITQEDPTGAWATATPADLRQLWLHLMEVGYRTPGVSSEPENLESHELGNVFYSTVIPRDLLSFEEFSTRLLGIKSCIILATGYIGDLLATLRERQASAP